MLKAFTGEQVPFTHPSHPAKDYVGVYQRPGYTPLTVTLKDGALYLTFIGTEAKLKHFHYDTFVLDSILGELPAGVPAHFHTAEVGGEIDSVALPLVTEQGGALVRFLKK